MINNTYVGHREIAEQLLHLDNFVICGHVSPDGDCIGSQLALWHALKSIGKEAECLLVKADSIEKGLSFLPGVDQMIPIDEYHGSPKVFIACDVPFPERMGDKVSNLREQCETTITIDHHQSRSPMSHYTYKRTDAASTTILVWEVIADMHIAPSADIATCSYTGLVTDTGRFQFQNTDEEAFIMACEMVKAGADPAYISKCVFQNRRIASLKLEQIALSRMQFGCNDSYVVSSLRRSDFEEVNAVKTDSEPIINTLRSIEGIRVACVLREDENGIRGSFRAKDDTDVAKIAEAMGGGGHRAAAGFTLGMTLEEALETVQVALEKALKDKELKETS